VNKTQKAVIASLIGTSAIAWIASIEQPDMMVAMTTYNPLAISLFTASWTAGMAAMMFPAITPMVLLYNRFVANNDDKKGKEERNQSALLVQEQQGGGKQSSSPSLSIRSLRVALFIGCYLLVWALTGVALLLGWSVVMNNTIMMSASTAAVGEQGEKGSSSQQLLPGIYGTLLIIAGAYQFTPLKRTCIGYCESPLSFFMRRWKDGTFGAVRMGLWHGLYCLGCCWAYFLLMVALGWMNLLWMGLFAGIIFAEKMWSRGIWVARAAGVGLVITGILVISGMLPSLVLSSASSMGESSSSGGMVMNDNSPDKMDSNSSNSNSSSIGESGSITTNDNGGAETAMRRMQDPSNSTSAPENFDMMSKMKMSSS
jgi:predicted metal-binding membrane protein